MTIDRFTELCTGYYGPGWIWIICLLVAIVVSAFWDGIQRTDRREDVMFNVIITIITLLTMIIHIVSRIGAS